MGLKAIAQSTDKKWDRYKGLDTFTQVQLLKQKAKAFDVSKINLQVTGNELRVILEDMFMCPINNYTWKAIKFCMDYNNWTLKEVIQVREKMNLLQSNVLQIVSCDKESLINS